MKKLLVFCIALIGLFGYNSSSVNAATGGYEEWSGDAWFRNNATALTAYTYHSYNAPSVSTTEYLLHTNRSTVSTLTHTAGPGNVYKDYAELNVSVPYYAVYYTKMDVRFKKGSVVFSSRTIKGR